MFLAQDPTLADFGHDPWWLVIIKVVVAFIFGMSMILLGVWFERRVVARMAVRPGLNQVGPLGLLQTLADGIKGMLKEDLLPRTADKVVFFFAPTVSAVTALTGAAFAAAEVLAHIDGRTPTTLGATVEIAGPGQSTRRRWSQHPKCGCRRRVRSRPTEPPARPT